jgi:hypothetical protein
MKKIYILFSFLIISNIAFADCYSNMVTSFNQTNQNFKDALADVCINVTLECMAGIEASLAEGPWGVGVAISILGEQAGSAPEQIDTIAGQYDQQYENIYNDYCACLGNVGC